MCARDVMEGEEEGRAKAGEAARTCSTAQTVHMAMLCRWQMKVCMCLEPALTIRFSALVCLSHRGKSLHKARSHMYNRRQGRSCCCANSSVMSRSNASHTE